MLANLPTDVLIIIFSKLNVADVISCQQSFDRAADAAAVYYRKCKKFNLTHAHLSVLESQSKPIDLNLIRRILMTIGPYIQTLRVDFTNFMPELVQPLSQIIVANCNRLVKLSIYGRTGIKIDIPSMRTLEVLSVRNCSFNRSAERGNALRKLRFLKRDDDTTDLLVIISKFPNISVLTVRVHYLSINDCHGISLLHGLQTLTMRISKPRSQLEENRQMIACKLTQLMVSLQSLKDLQMLKVQTPFYMKLPLQSVYMLLEHTLVHLEVHADMDKVHTTMETIDADVRRHSFMVPANLFVMRPDLDGLNAIEACIYFEDFIGNMQALEMLTHLESLQLTLRDRSNGDHSKHIKKTLRALSRGRPMHLLHVTLNANYTVPFDEVHMRAIKTFLRAADRLMCFSLLNCTPAFIARQEDVAGLRPNVQFLFLV